MYRNLRNDVIKRNTFFKNLWGNGLYICFSQKDLLISPCLLTQDKHENLYMYNEKSLTEERTSRPKQRNSCVQRLSS